MSRELMFLHRLALAMGRTVHELRHSMSWRELQDWRRYDILHPLPDKLPDIHHGILISTLVNLTRSAETMPAVPADFFVLRDRAIEPEADVPQGMSEAERAQAIWNGGR